MQSSGSNNACRVELYRVVDKTNNEIDARHTLVMLRGQLNKAQKNGDVVEGR